MGSFLIPANSKKSQLIFGLFMPIDLIIFGLGLGTTFIMLLVLPVAELSMAVLAISPGLITAFLVMPVPNYHNILTIIRSMLTFYTSRQRYIWKGWCYKDGNE